MVPPFPTLSSSEEPDESESEAEEEDDDVDEEDEDDVDDPDDCVDDLDGLPSLLVCLSSIFCSVAIPAVVPAMYMRVKYYNTRMKTA